MMVLGHQKAIAIGTWWYWVSSRQYWLLQGGTGSVYVSTG